MKYFLATLAALLLIGCSGDARPEKTASKPQGQQVDPRSTVLLEQARDALEAKEYQRALQYLEYVDRFNPDLPEAQFLRGHVMFALGRLDEAEAAFKNVLDRFPKYEAAWHSLGDVAYDRGQYQEALRHYLREDAINPTPQTWYNVGSVYRTLEKNDSAAVAYEHAVDMAPSYAPAHHALAELQEDLGEYESALQRARQALALEPENPEYRYLVGSMLLRTDRLEEAEAELRRVAEQRPWDYSSLYTLGQVLQRMGRQEEAADVLADAERARENESEIREAERAALRGKESAEAQMILAQEYAKLGRLDDALEQYQLALALDPDDLTIQQNIASILLAKERPEEALSVCAEILKHDSTRVPVLVITSAAYAMLGDMDESREAWARAYRLDPDHESIKQVLQRQ